MRIAAAVISTANRWPLVRDHILPRLRSEGFDEIVVVGDGESGDGYRHLYVPSITGTTVDALVKRDVAAVATGSEYLWYLSDDHHPAAGSLAVLEAFLHNHSVAALIPARRTWRETADGLVHYDLNSGAQDGYCGGHSGVFHRGVLRLYPWTTAPHDRLWDLLHSRRLQELGVEFHYAPDVIVEDVEHLLHAEVEPWR